MIGVEDAPNTFAYKDHFKILPMIHNWSSDPSRINDGVKVDDGFMYSSDKNEEWMPADTLRKWIDAHRDKAVSYTHLDVYKRQEYNRATIASCCRPVKRKKPRATSN